MSLAMAPDSRFAAKVFPSPNHGERKGGIATELHLFEKGGHGFGLRLPPTHATMRWPDLVLGFAEAQGFIV